MLKSYHNYISTHPQSLISRYFGLHRIDLVQHNGKTSSFYFIMMRNIFKTNKTLHMKFDLKGSTVGRITDTDGMSEE